jgi:HEPN domain-containing protein
MAEYLLECLQEITKAVRSEIGFTEEIVIKVFEGASGIKDNCLDELSKIRMGSNIDQSLETIDTEDMTTAFHELAGKTARGSLLQLLAGRTKSNEISGVHKRNHTLQDLEGEIQNVCFKSTTEISRSVYMDAYQCERKKDRSAACTERVSRVGSW